MMPVVVPLAAAVYWLLEISMIQLPRPIGMPAMLAVYWASSRPWAAAAMAGIGRHERRQAPTTKNAADSGGGMARRSDCGRHEGGQWLSSNSPARKPLVLSENASFLWFCAAGRDTRILSTLDLDSRALDAQETPPLIGPRHLPKSSSGGRGNEAYSGFEDIASWHGVAN